MHTCSIFFAQNYIEIISILVKITFYTLLFTFYIEIIALIIVIIIFTIILFLRQFTLFLQTCDQQVQTETTSENDGATSIAFCSEAELMERLQLMETVHNDEISSLISKHETEIKALSNVLSVSEHENKILQSETQTVKLSAQNSEIEFEELKKQVVELNNLKEKVKHYENECQRLQLELDESHVANSTVVNSQLVLNVGDTEQSDLKMKLKEATTENERLKAEVTKMETADMDGFKVKLEESVAECRKLKEEIAESKDLRGQLLEAQADVERLTNQLR